MALSVANLVFSIAAVTLLASALALAAAWLAKLVAILAFVVAVIVASLAEFKLSIVKLALVIVSENFNCLLFSLATLSLSLDKIPASVCLIWVKASLTLVTAWLANSAASLLSWLKEFNQSCSVPTNPFLTATW